MDEARALVAAVVARQSIDCAVSTLVEIML